MNEKLLLFFPFNIILSNSQQRTKKKHKKEFTNGLDLRNKYLHGTNSFSETEHKSDYYTLLKIIILTLLKIEDDILISRNVK